MFMYSINILHLSKPLVGQRCRFTKVALIQYVGYEQSRVLIQVFSQKYNYELNTKKLQKKQKNIVFANC